MAWEIERRFLVRVEEATWYRLGEGFHLRQGYVRNGDPSVRIRVGEARGAVLTSKSGKGVRRQEFETVVPPEIAEALFLAAEDRIIEKVRFRIGRWELDRFLGPLDGLALLEIELEREDEPIPPSPADILVLREVTDDKRFVSGRLARMTTKKKRKLVKKAYKEVKGWKGLSTVAASLGSIVALSACTMIGSEAVQRPSPTPETQTTVEVPIPTTPTAEAPSARGNMVEYEQSGRTYRILDSSEGYVQQGVASWYGEQFQGRPTSSGEPFDMHELSAAHRTLPIPSWVRVTNLDNGRVLVVRVNDRGPFSDPDRRIIDVSYAAAVALGMDAAGTANVRVEAVEPWQTRIPGS